MPKRNLIWILAIVAAAVVTVWVARTPPPVVSDPDQARFRSVVWTFRKIRDNYYRDVSPESLRRGAVNGMIGALDEFSSYVSPDRVEAFLHRIAGDQRGIGLRLRKIPDVGLVVIGPLVGSPAHKAGIVRGDKLLRIDGWNTQGASMREVRRRLRGKIGTVVTLDIMRADGKVESITLRRTEFVIETVRGLYRNAEGKWVWTIDESGRIAYVRIREFTKLTARQFRQAQRQMGSPRGIILDLRDNPGGLLTSAIEISDMFLRDGIIVEALSRTGGRRVYRANRAGTFPQNVPMIVLINERTASAAEIVAGALSVNHRAVVVGTRSRGKGCIQSIIPLPEKLGQMNLTTKIFLLGSKRPISRLPGSDIWGVDPHVQVVLSPVAQATLRDLWRKTEVAAPPMPTTAPTRPAAGDAKKFLELDDPLAYAVNLLDKPSEIRKILDHARQVAEAKARAQSIAGTEDND